MKFKKKAIKIQKTKKILIFKKTIYFLLAGFNQ